MGDRQEGPRGFEIVGDSGDETGREDGSTGAPIAFASFLISLSTSALIHLGVSPEGAPDEVEARIDLPLARQTIDILEMLRAKTEGNLDPDEVNLFDAILHDLHMRYVEASKS